ncbi:Rv3235 family protein [Pseudonocardia sp. RS11V-5]|uniref:Rv3235 family protein n=1 Tax=Pseudonocardia terrae TaxID=2905831 RepID=UPI001E65CDCE|nr:Rv3235 family protein [Pseudonocardia terrae]MCE3550185.1 Rv3235 family protein [Pseudonocardia terrae]
MTLTAPAPALPLFGTVAYEPALEPPVSLLDGEWGGDVPPGEPQGGPGGQGRAGREAAWVDESAVVAAGAAAAGPSGSSPAGDSTRLPAGTPDGRGRRERERAVAARRRAELVVRTALEVLDGRRPVRQLAPYAAPVVLRYVNAGVPRRGYTTAAGASLRSLHLSLPTRTAAEVAAVCRFGAKVRALAARLELTGQGEWRCVALRVI